MAMAYSDFVYISELEDLFGIVQKRKNLFPSLSGITPSERLLLDLEDADLVPINTEKAKSEHLIVPVLKEILRKNRNFSYFSGFLFDVDKTQGLSGYCDYIFSTETDAIEIKSPVFCIIEATGGVPQNRSLEEGYAQACAEMIASRIFNEKKGKPTPVVYGCVTNAFEWSFLKLEENNFWIDTERYYLDTNGLSQILSILQYIVELFVNNK
jgi:hypothetical protein